VRRLNVFVSMGENDFGYFHHFRLVQVGLFNDFD